MVSISVTGGMPATAVRDMDAVILRALKAATIGATEYAKETLRDRLRAFSPSPRLPNIVGSRVSPQGDRLAYQPAGSIYARGESASRIIRQLESGAPIRVRGAKALAIPLHGQRRGQRLATPKEIPGLIYIPPKQRSGRYVGLLALPRSAGLRQGRARSLGTKLARKAARQEASRDFVPMFALYRQVAGRKVFDEAQIAEEAIRQMPALFELSLAQQGIR
jgi:hypothetical protein